MSDTQTQSYSPARRSSKKTSPVLVWLLVLAIAIAAFAGAVMYAGGVGQVLELVGLSSAGSGLLGGLLGSSTPQATPSKPGAVAATSTAGSTATATPAASTLPDSAQRRMYAEQLESQRMLTELANGNVAAMKLGTASVAADKATVPVSATFKDGTSLDGFIVLRRYNGLWYFFEITQSLGDSIAASANGPFDSNVVAVITAEQAKPETQEMISQGLLGGGYTVVDVTKVSTGAGTTGVDVNLTGGSEPDSQGRFVLIKKASGGKTYWFITRFEKR